MCPKRGIDMRLKFYLIQLIFITICFTICYAQKNQQKPLTESQKNICQSVTSVKIIVQQDYGEAGNRVLPFKKKAKEYLSKYTNLLIVTDDSISCDAILNIHVKGTALSNKYGASHFSPSSIVHYSGAKLEGNFSYEISQISYFQGSIIGYSYPPLTINRPYNSPRDAPFGKAFEDITLGGELIKMIGMIYGIEPVIVALGDPEQGVRLAAIQTCAALNDPRAVEPLITALEKKDSKIGANIIRALGKMKDPRAVPAICSELKNAPIDAANALGEIKDPRAIKPLIDQLKITKNKWGSKQVGKALKKITGKNYGRNHDKWLKWWEDNKGNYQIELE
jgi:hypothetical protein